MPLTSETTEYTEAKPYVSRSFSSVKGVALITGAAAGIGEETGFAFAEAGALGVVFADVNEEGAAANAVKSKEYATNPKYRAVSIKVDVTKLASVQAMVDFAVKEFGRIDYSVNSAGVTSESASSVLDLDMENFDRILAVNSRGVMMCVGAVTKAMMSQEPLTHKGRHGERSLGRGCIINLASSASYVSGPQMLAYTTSKHAVMGITKSAALDNAKYHIRVNAVCPFFVDTPMLQQALKRVPPLAKRIEIVSPLGRAALPEEVADIIVFLCSPSASFVNGNGMMVDAGAFLTTRF